MCSAALVLTGCQPKPVAKDEPPSAEARAYVRNLKFSEVSLKATENFTGQVVTEVEGKITNGGDKTVDFAQVNCVFYDSMNQLILREKVAIIGKPLRPGETRAFRLPFDDIPQSWNNQMPQLVIAQIKLS